MKKYEVVIVGGGPGGLRCAEILAKNNKKVLVLEKKEVCGDKVCAGGLTLKDFDLKIPNNIIQRKFKKAIVHTPSQKVEIKLDKPFVATIDRKDLGKWMLKQSVESGANVKFDSKVTEISRNKLVINNKEKIKFKYLIGADGSQSIVRKYLGLQTNNFLQAFQYISPIKIKDIQLFVDPEKFGPAYLWIFPYKNSVSIGTGGDLSKKIKQPALGVKISEIRKNFDEWCMKRIEINNSQFQSFIINYDYQGHDFGNKFLIGDAGGFASGLTGEGIFNAIMSGEDVANKIIFKKSTYPLIKQIIGKKRFEEIVLRNIEINKKITRMEEEIFVYLLKLKWIDELVLENL
ncbi:MAG: NAD(P)/FAD-dependent oxidoreductase [archaeon]